MKKNFALHIEGKNTDRVLEAIKHEIRKYFKRERNRVLPKEGATSVYVEILSKHGTRVIRPENDPVIIERVDDVGSANR